MHIFLRLHFTPQANLDGCFIFRVGPLDLLFLQMRPVNFRETIRFQKGGFDSMPKFFIEVPHEAEAVACAKAIRVFLETGSHFLTNAEWGCMDGEHKAWFIIDVDTREEARNVVPHAFRRDAKITRLSRFTLEEINEMIRRHEG